MCFKQVSSFEEASSFANCQNDPSGVRSVCSIPYMPHCPVNNALCVKIPICHNRKLWRSARAHQFHSLGQDQTTVTHRAEMTVDERSLVSCV